MTTGRVHNEGADIVYDSVGQGPILLMIPGGGGAGDAYAAIAPILADKFTVVSYDRRARSRSAGDRNRDLDMAQQARDAAAVIRAICAERAYVFGNSGGASVGLKLAEDHPEIITALIVHEPPVFAILPNAEKELSFVDAVHAKFLSEGLLPALQIFMSSLVGFDANGPMIGQRLDPADAQFFMAHEYLNLSRYKPDLDAIRRSKVPIVALAGDKSADASYARTARVLAERLDCKYVEVPGNHMAFMIEPGPFAAALREILRDLQR